MNKKTAVGAAVSVILLAVLVAGIATVNWDDFTESDSPISLPDISTKPGAPDSIYDENGDLKENSLAYTVFEKYGLVLVPLAILMFGAMVGGVCIAREEVEKDDSN